MDPFKRWLEVKEIVEKALELSSDERAVFLDRTCSTDEDLRREVEALLHAPALPTSSLSNLLGLPKRPEDPDYVEGDLIDHFTILRRIGPGGMGVVYEARDTRNNNRPVAIKVLFSRAVRYSQDKQVASLTHPSIVTFHDSGETPEGLPYFVFEYIEGEPITTFCEHRDLSITERLKLVQNVCEAVAYAHQRYLIHCDLKPENILVTATGALKLLDFGIAKQVGEEHSSKESSPLTLPFASPEQVGGEETTTLSDVYSLGVLLCVLLTGRLPYRRTRSVADLRDAILHEEPARPSDLVRLHPDSASEEEEASLYCQPPSAKSPKQLARSLQGDLDSIVLRALHKEPAKRYAFATELAEDIQKYLTIKPVSAHTASRLYSARKLLRRHAWRFAIASSVFVVLLVMLAFLVGQYRRAIRGERLASAQAERTRQINRFVVDLLRRTNPFDPSSAPDMSVDELLDQSSRTIETSLSDYPDLKASILSVLGEIYSAREDVQRGRRLLETALALQRGGPRDQALAETLYRYGLLLAGQAHYRESEAALAEASEILDKLEEGGDPELHSRIRLEQAANKLNLGDYNAALELSQAALAYLRESPSSFPALAASFHMLGRVFTLKDRDAEAEALLRQALSYAERMPEPRNPHVAIILNALGTLMYKRGDYHSARRMYLRALDIHRTILGEDSRSYAVTLHNLAALAVAQGQYQEALEKFARVVEIFQKSLPQNHLSILTTRGQLASVLINLQEYERAERMLLELLKTARVTLPKGHPLVGTTLNSLAFLYQDQGRLRESQALYREALDIFTTLVGRNSRPVATLLGNLGTLARSQGDEHSAEMHFREALNIVRGIDGGKNPDKISAMINLASLYIATGDLEKAGDLVSEAIPLAESIVGPTGQLTGSVYSLEARLFLAQGDFRAALSRARQARTILSASLPPRDWRIAAADSVIGAALAKSGEAEEAEALLLHSLSELRRIKGDQWPQTREARERVRSFYQSLGRSDEAAKYRR